MPDCQNKLNNVFSRWIKKNLKTINSPKSGFFMFEKKSDKLQVWKKGNKRI